LVDRADLPHWVVKAEEKWEAKLGHNPYDMKKTFVGKHHVYKVEFKTIEQGRVSEEWTVEKRQRHHRKVSTFSKIWSIFGK
jgi:hypothetical protein